MNRIQYRVHVAKTRNIEKVCNYHNNNKKSTYILYYNYENAYREIDYSVKI